MLQLRWILERLFHKDGYLPPEAKEVVGRNFRLRYTAHAIKAAREDRYGMIDLRRVPSTMRVEYKEIVEVELDDESNAVSKVVIRRPYDDKRDVVLVLIPYDDGTAIVKTVWCNLKNDNHMTLNLTRYEPRPTHHGQHTHA